EGFPVLDLGLSELPEVPEGQAKVHVGPGVVRPRGEGGAAIGDCLIWPGRLREGQALRQAMVDPEVARVTRLYLAEHGRRRVVLTQRFEPAGEQQDRRGRLAKKLLHERDLTERFGVAAPQSLAEAVPPRVGVCQPGDLQGLPGVRSVEAHPCD